MSVLLYGITFNVDNIWITVKLCTVELSEITVYTVNDFMYPPLSWWLSRSWVKPASAFMLGSLPVPLQQWLPHRNRNSWWSMDLKHLEVMTWRSWMVVLPLVIGSDFQDYWYLLATYCIMQVIYTCFHVSFHFRKSQLSNIQKSQIKVLRQNKQQSSPKQTMKNTGSASQISGSLQLSSDTSSELLSLAVSLVVATVYKSKET